MAQALNGPKGHTVVHLQLEANQPSGLKAASGKSVALVFRMVKAGPRPWDGRVSVVKPSDW